MGNLYAIIGRMNCGLSLVGRKNNLKFCLYLPAENKEGKLGLRQEVRYLSWLTVWVSACHSFVLLWCYVLTWVMKIRMRAIRNFHAGHRFPILSLGNKGNKLTYARVKQANLAEMEIWATTLGYTW